MGKILARAGALLLGLAACASGVPEPFPDISRLHFPTGLAVDVPYALDQGAADGGAVPRAHWLYVNGNSNFDQVYSRGVVMAVDLDGYGPPDTGLVPPELLADGGNWDGTPLSFPDIGDAGTVDPAAGWVYTDGLGGELRLAPTSAGGERVLLATREQNRLAFIDVGGDGGRLDCTYGDGGRDCLDDVSSPPLVELAGNGGNELLDVFDLSPPVRATLPDGGLGPPEVLVGNLRNVSTAVAGMFGMMGMMANPYTSYTATMAPVSAYVVRQSVDDPQCRMAEPVGLTPAAGVLGIPGPSGFFALLTGRFQGMAAANVEVLSLPPPTCLPSAPQDQVPIDPTPPPPAVIDLSQIVKETDGRALALSSSGDRVFALSIGPDSLVILRIDGSSAGGLNIHPSTVVPLPTGPSELLPIPRRWPDGSAAGDLVAVSCPGTNLLAFYDDEVGEVTAALSGVGDEPFAIASAPRTAGTGASARLLPGVRLFVSAFGSGQIAVVDVPDPFDASGARVVAILGSWEDTTASPVNPLTSQFLTLPYGYSGSPVL